MSSPPGASCWICLEDGPDDAGQRLLRNCACRGDSGYAHVSCVSEHARRASEAASAKNDLVGITRPWAECMNCKQLYNGDMQQLLAESFVESCRHLPESDLRRFESVHNLATARFACGRVNHARKLYEQLLDTLDTIPCDTRRWKAEILQDLAQALHVTGRTKEGAECYEKARQIKIEMHGLASDEVRSADEHFAILNGFVSQPEDSAKAVREERKHLERNIEKYGKECRSSMAVALPLQRALLSDGKFSEAIDVLEVTINTSRRVLGPDHSDTKKFEAALQNAKFQQCVSKIATSSSSAEKCKPTRIMATVTGVPPSLDANGKEVEVLRAAKGDKYIVLLEKNGTPTNVKVSPLNLRFAAGTKVTVKGLEPPWAGRNGLGGVIKSYDNKRKRYVVSLVDDQGGGKTNTIRLKPENTQIVLP